jgi:hypothetical protein
MPLQ